MSRHRDVRSMNYSDEYDGYDDVYGHSVEDDYCVSPSMEQFMYDRNKKHNISSFMNDISEDNSSELQKESNLSEMEKAKLISCIEAIRGVIGDTIPEKKLTEEIIKANFSTEMALDKLLQKSSAMTNTNLNPIVKQSQDSCPAVKIVSSTAKPIKAGFDLKESSTQEDDIISKQPGNETVSQKVFTQKSDSEGSHTQQQNGNNLQIQKESISSKSNTPRNQSPISGHTTPDVETKSKTHEVDVAAVYQEKRGSEKKPLNLVVVGHVDAGKSTLLGRLLCDMGQISSRLIHKYQQDSKKIGKQSFAYAWVLDETGEERERGITMDVGRTKFETETKCITLLDAPGHKDFIPNMITGATQADVALLVVDATRGEFETGFDSGGQTREHALLLRSLGVSQIAVVVNKLDTVEWSKDRFNEIVEKLSVFLKQAGFKDTVTFIPCSGLSGENVVISPKNSLLCSWYTGPTLLEMIENFKCPERPVDKPFRFIVNDVFKGTGSGFCVSGHIETGMVSVTEKVLLLPQNEVAVVKGLLADEKPIPDAFAGDHVSLTLAGIEQQNVGVGDVICSPRYPVPVTTCFQAHVVIFAVATPITKGFPVVLHQQSLIQPAVISKLVAQLHRNTGDTIKKKPRCLIKNTSAIVEIVTQTPICVELYKDIKQLGRIMLRVAGTTIAAGLITKIK